MSGEHMGASRVRLTRRGVLAGGLGMMGTFLLAGGSAWWKHAFNLWQRELYPGQRVRIRLPPGFEPRKTGVFWQLDSREKERIPAVAYGSGLLPWVEFEARPPTMSPGTHSFLLEYGALRRRVGGFVVRPFYFGF